MLDQEKISLSKIKQAYALNDSDLEILLSSLWPQSIFPWELWFTTYEKFWKGFAERNAMLYRAENPVFPKNNIEKEKFLFTHIYAIEILTFFKRLAVSVNASALKEGLKHIFECTYEETIDSVLQDEIDILLDKLISIEKSAHFEFYLCYEEDEFMSVFEEKCKIVPVVYYDFISRIYVDTILVKKSAAILYLDSIHYPLRREVKGITHGLVAHITSKYSSNQENQVVQHENSTPVQSKGILVLRSLWEGKTPEAVCADMQQAKFDSKVIAHILFYKQGFKNKRKVGRLLSDPNLSDGAHDKNGAQLYDESKSIRATASYKGLF